MTSQTLEVIKTTTHKPKPDPEALGFGKYFTDHMLLIDYHSDKGWYHPRIVPYEPLTLDPAAMVFHYGQTVFEGLKAYKDHDENVRLFRPEENMKRLNRSNERLSIPTLDEKETLSYIKELVRLEKDWIPTAAGKSLYIRPFVINTEASLSVAPSKTYTFLVILSPVGSYYSEGIDPVSIFVEDFYTRAAPGGTGYAKTAGNYSAAYKAQERAVEHQRSQVLWLDGLEKKYVEEVGSMNVFFKIDGEIHTPEINGTILEGVTRKSVIELLRSWDIPVHERRIAMDDLIQAHQNGTLEEAFGTGTAAVISPIGILDYKGTEYTINNNKTGDISNRLHNAITGIQTGRLEDPFGWTTVL